MEITVRALVTLLHGLLSGGLFLMALYGLASGAFTAFFVKEPAVLSERGRRLEDLYLAAVAGLGWITVLSGAYVVYPWYRAAPPQGAATLAQYPQRLLMSRPSTSGWHTLGMEWKEHAAWISAIAMTAAAYLLTAYRNALKDHPPIRLAAAGLIFTAFFSAAAAGVFGALLNKYAPIQGGASLRWTVEKQ